MFGFFKRPASLEELVGDEFLLDIGGQEKFWKAFALAFDLAGRNRENAGSPEAQRAACCSQQCRRSVALVSP
jgi:hypothetical protein